MKAISNRALQHSVEDNMEDMLLASSSSIPIASLDLLSRLKRLQKEQMQNQRFIEMAIVMQQQQECILAANQRSRALGDASSRKKMLQVDPIEKTRREQSRQNQSVICANKVEKALRSRPQRGKKRTDLTVEERNELTRKRNREHARNTRLRKKVRELELEENQKTLESFLASKKLHSERIDRLKQFLSARQNMINTSAVAFQLYGEQVLSDLVVDQDIFQFETRGLDRVASCDKENKMPPLTKMRFLDQELRKKIFESHDISFSTFFAYEVQGGVDGIAISNNGSCYAQFDLVLYQADEARMLVQNELNRHKTVLFNIHMKARFGEGENSSKLASMEWIILKN